MNSFICLGRNGDLLNAVSLASHFRHNGQVEFITCREFCPFLEGFSWIRAIPWDGAYNEVLKAKRMYPHARIAQWYSSGAPMTQESYQMEIWAMNRCEEKFGTEALVFDNRSYERERELLKIIDPHPAFPLILVAGKGVSSPLPNSLYETLEQELIGCNVVNLDEIQAEKPQDMLALLDRASCLVSIDSFFLHLARASTCPVVSILNDGWRGSIPPPQSVSEHRYSTLNEQAVVDDVLRLLKPVGRKILVVDDHGTTVRHKAARKTWDQFDVVLASTKWRRNATMIGNARPLPFVKDLLERALSVAETGDVVFLSNSDTQLSNVDRVAHHAHRFGAVSIRRDERNGEKHIGRELYAFSASYLRDNLQAMPDVVGAMPWVDLCLARYIRSTMRIRTTGAPKTVWSESNLWQDFFPSELPPGPAYHPAHSSSWNSVEEQKTPAYRWNSQKWEDGWKDSF